MSSGYWKLWLARIVVLELVLAGIGLAVAVMGGSETAALAGVIVLVLAAAALRNLLRLPGRRR